MADKNFKVKNGLEVGDRDIVTPDGTITLPEGSGTLAKTSDVPSSEVVISEQTGTSYTLQQSDANKLIEFNNSSPINVTAPGSISSFPIGTQIDLLQTGTGTVNIQNEPAGWTTRVSGLNGSDIYSAAYGNGNWVLMAQNKVSVSTDYITWNAYNLNNYFNMEAFAYGNGVWVAGGTDGVLITSTNGTTWTERSSNFSNIVTGVYGSYNIANIKYVRYGNGRWFISGENDSVKTSTDTITWTSIAQTFSNVNVAIAYGNGNWIFAGSSGVAYISSDPTNTSLWTTITTNFSSYGFIDAAYGNGIWVAGGSNGKIYTSTDGITWATQTSNFGTNTILSIAYGNGRWIAGGEQGQMRVSTDGATWTTETSNFGITRINSVAYGNGAWVAASFNDTLRTSTQSSSTVTSLDGTLNLPGQWGFGRLIKRTSNGWILQKGNTYNSPIFTGSATTSALNVTGILDASELRESVVNTTLSSNTATLDWTAGNVYYIATAPTGAMTFNATNVPTDNSKMLNITVFVTQGSTGYIPSTFQIGGVGQTIKWADGSAPTPTSSAGKIDIFSFTLQRTSGGAWIVYATSILNF